MSRARPVPAGPNGPTGAGAGTNGHGWRTRVPIAGFARNRRKLNALQPERRSENQSSGAFATARDSRSDRLNLMVPKLRRGRDVPGFPEPRKTSGKAPAAAIQEAWIGGASPRRVGEPAPAMGRQGMSKSTVPKLSKDSDGRVHERRDRLCPTRARCPVPGPTRDLQAQTRRPRVRPGAGGHEHPNRSRPPSFPGNGPAPGWMRPLSRCARAAGSSAWPR